MGFFENLGPFAVFATIAAFTPGPNNIMLAASGANFGLRRTLPHILGVTAGFMTIVLAGGMGLGGLLTVAPFLYDTLRLFAFGFLAYMAYKIATSSPATNENLENQIQNDSHAPTPIGFWMAYVFQWMNPKALIVVFSAITAYIHTGEKFISSLVVIMIIFLIVTILSTILWCWLGTIIARFLSTPRAIRLFNISMALLLVGSLLPVLITA